MCDDNEEEEGLHDDFICFAHQIPPYVFIPPSDVPASEWIADLPVTD